MIHKILIIKFLLITLSYSVFSQDIRFRVQFFFSENVLTEEGIYQIIGKKIKYNTIPYVINNTSGYVYSAGSFRTKTEAENFNTKYIKPQIPDAYIIITKNENGKIKKLTVDEIKNYYEKILSPTLDNDIPKSSNYYKNTNGIYNNIDENKVFMYVQVAATKKPFSKTDLSKNRYKYVDNVMMKRHNGWYIYIINDKYESLAKAENSAKLSGVDDAFVVYILNGYRIDIEQTPFSDIDNPNVSITQNQRDELLSKAKNNQNNPIGSFNYQDNVNNNTSDFDTNTELDKNNETEEYINRMPTTEAQKFPFKNKDFVENQYFVQFQTSQTKLDPKNIKEILKDVFSKYDIFEHLRGDNYNYLIGGPFERENADKIRKELFNSNVISFVPRARDYSGNNLKRILLSEKKTVPNVDNYSNNKKLKLSDSTTSNINKNTPVEVPLGGKNIVRVFSFLNKKEETELKAIFKNLYEKFPIYEQKTGKQYVYLIGGPFSSDEADAMRVLLSELEITVRSRVENIVNFPNLKNINNTIKNTIKPSEELKKHYNETAKKEVENQSDKPNKKEKKSKKRKKTKKPKKKKNTRKNKKWK